MYVYISNANRASDEGESKECKKEKKTQGQRSMVEGGGDDDDDDDGDDWLGQDNGESLKQIRY